MADNIDNLLANVKKMVDSGNIPPEVQQMMNNLQNSSNSSSNLTNDGSVSSNGNNGNGTSSNFNNSDNIASDNNNSNSNIDLNNILSQVSPEMLNNLSSMFQNNSSNSNNSSSNGYSPNSNSSGFNLDMNTMLKMKNIISSMNQKDDPRANLLYSLKPYLRDNKKGKLDQYVNLLNMSKIADFMKNDSKENN